MRRRVRRRPRRAAALVAAVALLVAGGVLAALPARAAFSTGVEMAVAHSGKCLSLSGGSAADGTAVVQHSCQNLVAEHWRAVPQSSGGYQVVSDTSDKCMNVSGASTADLAHVIEWPCVGAANERWQVRPVPDTTQVQLVSEISGKCLDVAYGSTAEDAPVVQYTCSTATSQHWWYQPARAQQHPVPVEQNSRLTALQTNDGHIEYAFTDNAGRLLHGRQTDPADPATTTWEVLGGSQRFTGTPAVASPNSTLGTSLTVQGTDSDIWLASRPYQGTAYSPVRDVGGASTSHAAVDILLSTPTRPWVDFAVDPTGVLWQQPRDDTVPFLGWRSLGQSGVVGTPQVIRIIGGARLLGLDSSGRVRMATYSDGNADATSPITWSTLPGSGFRAVTEANDHLFAMAADGSIQTTTLPVGSYTTWATIGTLTAAGPPAAYYVDSFRISSSRLDLVVRGTDGAVYETGQTSYDSSTWRPWQRISQPGDEALTDPTVFGISRTSSFGVVWRTAAGHVALYRVTADIYQPPVFTRYQLPDPPS